MEVRSLDFLSLDIYCFEGFNGVGKSYRTKLKEKENYKILKTPYLEGNNLTTFKAYFDEHHKMYNYVLDNGSQNYVMDRCFLSNFLYYPAHILKKYSISKNCKKYFNKMNFTKNAVDIEVKNKIFIIPHKIHLLNEIFLAKERAKALKNSIYKAYCSLTWRTYEE